ncbi:hypothetical protein [Streptomyces sp. NPDC101237]|uniref:Orn/Lys/Arg family decarboxylase n=1 Tax=Streptomyces sp. NPDC101237 TaxID=3366139 RepID=UPI00382DF72A
MRRGQVRPPRDACFEPHEDVPTHRAAGRLAGDVNMPYPPGRPAVLPGERLTQPVLRHLTSGVATGKHVPDAAATQLNTIRMVAHE